MAAPQPEWTFFSNHAHVLVCLASDRHARLRDVAARVGITERTALRLVSQLADAGILVREKEGRRNWYRINLDRHLRHPIEAHCTVGELLGTILDDATLDELRTETVGRGSAVAADSEPSAT